MQSILHHIVTWSVKIIIIKKPLYERERKEHFFISAIFSKNTEARFCVIFLHKWRKDFK